MAGRKGTPPKALVLAQTPGITDPALQRAFDVVTRAIQDLQSRRHLEQFTVAEPGYVPESGGNAAYFLAADGVWKSIVGSGAVDSVTAGSSMVTASPTTGAVVVDVVPANFTGIPESGITSLISDLAARPTGSGTSGKSTRWTGTSVLGDGAFLDDGTDVSLAGTLTLSTFTPGSVLFAGAGGLVSQDNPNFFWDDPNNRLGIGTPTPSTPLHVVGDVSITDATHVLTVGATAKTKTNFLPGIEVTRNGNVDLVISSYGTGTRAQILLARGRGTAAAQTAVLSGDQLGQLAFTGVAGSGGTEFFSSGLIRGVATQDFNTTTNFGGKLEFYTTTNSAGSGGRGLALTLDQDRMATFTGNVAITSTTTPQLVVGAATNTKTPTLGVAEFTHDAATTQVAISTYAAGAWPTINMVRGRGTAAATTAVLNGDPLGTIAFSGATGSGSSNITGSIFVSGWATENWSGTAVGSKITLSTGLNGTTTRAIKLTVENDGGISLSNSAAAAVSAASQVTLRANTQLQVSENTGAYVTVAKGTGTAGTHVKWSNTTGTLADSLISDTGSSVTVGSVATQSHTILGKTTIQSNGSSTDTLILQSLNAAGFSSALFKDNGGTNKGALGYANASAGDTNVAGKFYWHSLGGTDTVFATGSTTPSTRALTLFDATGNINIGTATADPGVKLSVQGTSKLDGQVDVNSHKIVNLTNGSSAQDAAAFGQIATAVNAAVSGTANTLAKFTSANVVGNSSITDNGTAVDISAGLLTGGVPTGAFQIKANSGSNGNIVMAPYGASGALYLNYGGTASNGGIRIYDGGTSTQVASIASDGSATFGASDSASFTAQGVVNTFKTTGVNGNTVLRVQNDAQVWQMGVIGTASDNFYFTDATGSKDIWVMEAATSKTTWNYDMQINGSATICDAAGDKLTFYGGTGATQQTITGSRGGNAALADLLTKLATLGLIVDSTSA